MDIIEYGSDMYGNIPKKARLPINTSASPAQMLDPGVTDNKVAPIQTSNVSEFTFILTLGIIAFLLFFNK